MVAGPLSGCPVIRRSVSVAISVPSARNPAIISRVSRASSQPEIRLSPDASAASTSARLVIDFDPGICTDAVKGRSQCGAAQISTVPG